MQMQMHFSTNVIVKKGKKCRQSGRTKPKIVHHRRRVLFFNEMFVDAPRMNHTKDRGKRAEGKVFSAALTSFVSTRKP